MKLRKQAFVSFTCALALAGNPVSLLAQDKAQEKTTTQTQTQVQRKVILKTPDGQTQEFNVEGDGTVLVSPDGKFKAQVKFSSAQDGTATTAKTMVFTGQDGKEIKLVPSQGANGQFVVTPSSGGVATFQSLDGTMHNLDGQNYTFVRSGSGGQDFTYNFVSSEMSFDSKLVKGAPFTADTENESVKVLADGNRIVHKNTGSIARDSEGRTRRENTINAIGQFAGNESRKTITLNDPVAGAIFILEPDNRIARKMGGVRSTAPSMKVVEGLPLGEAPKKVSVSGGVLQGSAIKKANPSYPPIAKAAKATGVIQVQITISEEGKVIGAEAISGHPLLRDAAVEAARQWEFKPTMLSGQAVKVQGILSFNFSLQGEEANINNQSAEIAPPPTQVRAGSPAFNSNTESLGKQMIEGVEAEGKRTVTTIPVGAIGNERSIEIVSESWFSPELKTVVMSKRTDPTSGETTFRLTNIRRGEPDASLFQVPSDYTVKEGGFATGGFGTGAGVGGTIRLRETKPDNK